MSRAFPLVFLHSSPLPNEINTPSMSSCLSHVPSGLGAAVTATIAIAFSTATALAAATPVPVQDFEKPSSQPTVWVVNIPNDNASVTLSPDQPQQGKQCLFLHYKFVSSGNFQYLGIPLKTRINAPIHELRVWIRGNNSHCSYGIQLNDAGDETHQFKHSRQGGSIDFTGWKEVAFNLDEDHETWGGDKNGKLNYPITKIILTVGQPREGGKNLAAEGDIAFDTLTVNAEKSLAETLGCQIAVVSPDYASDIQGTTAITLSAPGFTNATVKCWQQGAGFGTDATVARVPLDAQGNGNFAFPADTFPHGPLTLRISATNGSATDTCCLQLYNQGGQVWKIGIPKTPPPAAQGMTLVFEDDFDKPLSISSKDSKARYYDHKPPGGSQDFSTLRFTSAGEPNDPFKQIDSFLRIRASEKAQSAGLISSIKNDATGITAKIPCYFECRFIGPNAIGTWPAFWLMTDYMTDHVKGREVPCDELDIIEAYGGEGPGSPNAHDTYMITPHCWNQGDTGKATEKAAFETLKNPAKMARFGIPSTWYDTFHTYGCKITETDTLYYCDDIEVGRHPTLPLSKKYPFFFMINLATGGGWPVDLSRYNGTADMYIDFVRVYQGK
jgi:hypothetical protein